MFAVLDESSFQLLVLIPVWLTFLVVCFGAFRGR